MTLSIIFVVNNCLIMTYLIVDTSTDICIIALVKAGEIDAERIFPHYNQLSKNLLLSIQELMEETQTTLSDLSYIAVGIGPGSYTGTRLGAAVAKSLAFALNIEVKPFSSPLAFLPDQTGSFLFLIPTRAGLIFALKGEQNATQVIEHNVTLTQQDLLDDSVNYVVSSTVFKSLSHKPFFNASPHSRPLLKFLSQAKTISPELVKIQYLHTPF